MSIFHLHALLPPPPPLNEQHARFHKVSCYAMTYMDLYRDRSLEHKTQFSNYFLRNTFKGINREVIIYS